MSRIIMKKLILVILILPLILLCGFSKKDKPTVILSSSPISGENLNRAERVFTTGQKIYYALIIPDGAKYAGIRMQISSQNEKTSNWGYSIRQTKDIYLPKSNQAYWDYFVIRVSGNYAIQFFYLNKKIYPFVHKEFLVK